MITIVGALAPIFLLVLLGWTIRAREFVPLTFWPPAEKLTYYVLFPALLVTNLAEAKLDGLPVASMSLAQAGGVLIMAALAALSVGVLSRRPFRLDGPGFTSAFQGSIRPNTYVGLAAAAGLWGSAGLTLTAICVAVVVPLVNLLSVVALVRWAGPKDQPARPWRSAIVPVLKNPLIAACLIGIALNYSGIGLPPIIGPLLKILGAAALPIGLLAVGAGLELKGLRAVGPAMGLVVSAKLILLPAITTALAWHLGVRDLALVVCAIYAGLPMAPNSYVLARQMGGDARLMAGLITLSTLAAALTLPVLAVVVG